MNAKDQKEIELFQKTVWEYYDAHGRFALPWRVAEVGSKSGGFDPYKVLVSEVMLQQTQVSRVIVKYAEFIELFPTVQTLAKAGLGEVLVVWQGLGYNRRAKFLWQAAQMVVNDYGGKFPDSQQELTRLPGVGVNTAGAIMAYAYDQPVVFIETNIRTVFIHHFFADREGIHDREVGEWVEATLPAGDTRFWYWALMDYGTHLKQTVGNKSRASKSYAKQSPLKGSRRAVRGAVIRLLTKQGQGTFNDFTEVIDDPRLAEVLHDLEAEGMVRKTAGMYRLA